MHYYALEIQPWEEQLAWGDEFDEEKKPKCRPHVRQIIEEEEQEPYDWGKNGEVVAPFMMYKP